MINLYSHLSQQIMCCIYHQQRKINAWQSQNSVQAIKSRILEKQNLFLGYVLTGTRL